MARYLFVNPVGTDTWDAQDEAYLRSLVAPGDEVRVASLTYGPPAVDTETRLVEAEYGVAALLDVLAEAGRAPERGPGRDVYDAVVINCCADPGLAPGRELLACPVLGAGETALALAPLFGEGVAVLAPDENAAVMFRRYLRRLGLEGMVGGIYPLGVAVADLERQPDRTVECTVRAALRAHEEANAQVMVLGCTGLAPLAPRVAAVLEGMGLVVLEPMALAFRAAQVLVRLGLSHFRGGLYAPYREPPVGRIQGYGAEGTSGPGEQAGVFTGGPGGRIGGDPDPVDVLLVNPVVSPGLLSWVPEYAHTVLPPWTRVHVKDITEGPPCIETFYQEACARPGVVRAARGEEGAFDVSVVNCFADPAVRALRESTGRPALGLAEASCRLALLLGHRFGVVSTGRNAGPWTELQVREMGLTQRLAGAVGIDIGVLELSSDEAVTAEAIVSEARNLVGRAGAEVIVLGCGAMAKMAGAVAQKLDVPVLEPLAVALNLADLVGRARPWRKR
ncbi:MAG: aspartate/glutamate racemase family protein [Bacillota bacterium]